MPVIREQTLLQHIREKSFLSCYLIYGAETYMARLYTKKLVHSAVLVSVRGFNFNRFDGERASLDEIETAATTAPLLSPRRVVLVEDLPVDKLSKTDMKQFQLMLKRLPESTVFLLLVSDPAVTVRSVPKLKTLITAFSSAGGVVEFAFKQQAELVKKLTAYAKKQNCTLSSKVGYELINRCGRSVDQLLVVMDKLCAYVNSGEITSSAVELLTVPAIETSVFDLAKAILRKDKSNALLILNNLLLGQTEPLAILGALNMSFVDLYRAKCAQMATKTVNDITDCFPYRGSEFRVRNAMRDAASYSIEHIRSCLKLLSKADVVCKSRYADVQVLLEKTIVQMMLEEKYD